MRVYEVAFMWLLYW